MYDVIILGGGPAGLTATMYAIQKRLDALLITRDLGGKTIYRLHLPWVERHQVINGDEILQRFSREIDYLGYVMTLGNVERVDSMRGGYALTLTGGTVYQTRNLIMATGAKAQQLEIPGEQNFIMHGLCYSALSYAHLFIDRSAVVIGDGDLALRATAELARNAHHVTLIAGEDSGLETPLGHRLQAMDHVEFLTGHNVCEIRGDVYARSLLVKGPDGEREIFADGIFIEKELVPRSSLVSHLVTLDKKGFIQINSRNETSAPGIYAAGDVTSTFSEQVLISIGEGAKAALSAYENLLKREPTKALA